MTTKSVSVRLTTEQLAKARDGLLHRGIPAENLLTKSHILRLSIFLAITMTENPEELPSDESLILMEK